MTSWPPAALTTAPRSAVPDTVTASRIPTALVGAVTWSIGAVRSTVMVRDVLELPRSRPRSTSAVMVCGPAGSPASGAVSVPELPVATGLPSMSSLVRCPFGRTDTSARARPAAPKTDLESPASAIGALPYAGTATAAVAATTATSTGMRTTGRAMRGTAAGSLPQRGRR